jgi:hypothetical protein
VSRLDYFHGLSQIHADPFPQPLLEYHQSVVVVVVVVATVLADPSAASSVGVEAIADPSSDPTAVASYGYRRLVVVVVDRPSGATAATLSGLCPSGQFEVGVGAIVHSEVYLCSLPRRHGQSFHW